MKVSLSEWLRSETWNLMGFPRAGSNPAADVFLVFGIHIEKRLLCLCEKKLLLQSKVIPKWVRDFSFLLFGDSWWWSADNLWRNSLSRRCHDRTFLDNISLRSRSNEIIRDVLLLIFMSTIWRILTVVADSNFINLERWSLFDFFFCWRARNFSAWASHSSLWLNGRSLSWARSGEFRGKLSLALWRIRDIRLQGLASVHFVTLRHVRR